MSSRIPDPEKVRLRLASLCARAEQCEADMRAKSARAGLTAGQTEDIISFLKRERFVDNARFARAYAADKARFAGWGIHKIRQGLAARHISREDAEKAISQIDRVSYSESLMRVAMAKSRNLDLSAREDSVKLYRHLCARGYTSAEAVEAVRIIRRSQREAAERAEHDPEPKKGGEDL